MRSSSLAKVGGLSGDSCPESDERFNMTNCNRSTSFLNFDEDPAEWKNTTIKIFSRNQSFHTCMTLEGKFGL